MFGLQIGTLGLIAIALIALSVLVLVHELGHFIAAKKSGIFVEEFGIGLPPRLIGKKFGETIYSVNALPIGGFVKLHGEEQGEKITQPERAFSKKPPHIRALVAIAGVVMNFVFAILGFALVYSINGIPQEIDTDRVEVVDVVEDSAAEKAGFVSGDVILTIDGQVVQDSDVFIERISERRGENVEFEIKKSATGNIEKTTVKLADVPPEKGSLGVVISSKDLEYYFPPLWQRPFVGIYYGFKDALFLSRAIIVGMADMIGGVFSGEKVEGVLGPAGITATIAHVADIGILPLINFIGLISVNLAVLNLMPFPPLDGFRLLTIGIEGVFGKKMIPKFENWVHAAGMAVLIGIMLLVTIKEIPKIFQAGSLSGFVESVIPGL